MNSLERTIDAITYVLTHEIVPRVDDAFARGQALAIIELLRNLGPRLEWSHTVLWQQIEAQEAALRRVAELCADEAQKPPVVEPQAFSGEHPSGRELEQYRDRLDEQISSTLVWLDAVRDRHAARGASEIEATLRRYMNEQLQRDMTLTQVPLFREISSGAKTTSE
jgi:hypothetical protein